MFYKFIKKEKLKYSEKTEMNISVYLF